MGWSEFCPEVSFMGQVHTIDGQIVNLQLKNTDVPEKED